MVRDHLIIILHHFRLFTYRNSAISFDILCLFLVATVPRSWRVFLATATFFSDTNHFLAWIHNYYHSLFAICKPLVSCSLYPSFWAPQVWMRMGKSLCVSKPARCCFQSYSLLMNEAEQYCLSLWTLFATSLALLELLVTPAPADQGIQSVPANSVSSPPASSIPSIQTLNHINT